MDELKSFIEKNIYLSLLITAAISLGGTYAYMENIGGEDANEVYEHVSESKNIVAAISGAVENPGVYELPENARIADLLAKGGEILDEASIEWVSYNLNPSKLLEDEEKIYIPFEWDLEMLGEREPVETFASVVEKTKVENGTSVSGLQGSASVESEGGSSKINLNTASQKEIIDLPRIGEVLSQRIIDNRPYENFDDLQEKADISDSVVEEIKELVSF